MYFANKYRRWTLCLAMQSDGTEISLDYIFIRKRTGCVESFLETFSH